MAGMDPTGKIGKQVGWLNRKAGLVQQIDFSKVIGPLSNLDITSAMSILKDVEQNGSSISNPTEYIEQACAALPPAQRTTTRVDLNGNQVTVTVHMDPTGKIGRQVQWLNRNLTMADTISFQDVVEPLSMIDVSTAMTILRELEQKAASIHNPTQWVIQAAAKAAAESGTGNTPAYIGALDPTGKISRQVTWLNRNGNLPAPLVFAEVVQPLSQLDIVSAMAVLKEYEQSAAGISDATAWITQASERAAANGGAAPEGVPLGAVDPSGKISRQVAWLNRNCNFETPINFAEVAGPLSRIDIAVAMSVLKECEDQANNLRDPNPFIISAAERAPKSKGGGGGGCGGKGGGKMTMAAMAANMMSMWGGYGCGWGKGGMGMDAMGKMGGWSPSMMLGMMGGPAGKGKGGGGGGGSSSSARRTDTVAKPQNDEVSRNISGEIGRLNRGAGFWEPLSYSDVKGHLEAIGWPEASRILLEVGMNAATIQSPTNYVIAAAKRVLNGEGPPQKRMRMW